ncbi:MAG: hypothetical protein FJW29_05475 [Acidobacteria bacterium]|nr:hypothetical protein [Acidobacteriota bacterium]
MRARVVSSLAAGLVIAATLGLALQAAPSFWVTATQAEWLKGRVEQVAVDAFGRAMLGPSLTTLADPATAVVWSLATDAGGTVYAGTGHDGRVYRLSATGTPTVFFDSSEAEVHAMTAAPGGGLFVATSPEGRIYRVSATGDATTFFDPEERYIWALATDTAGRLYAATGDRGVVYRISTIGQGEALFTPKADHVTGLLMRADGTLLATTAGPGRLFSIGTDGRGFLMLDSGFTEVRQPVVDRTGQVFVAALNGTPGSSTSASPEPTPSVAAAPSTGGVSVDVVSVTIAGTASATVSTGAGSAGASGGSGAIFRVMPDGLWDRLWSSDDASPLMLAIDEARGLVVATSHEGQLLSIDRTTAVATVLGQLPSAQGTAALVQPNRLLVATANPGRVSALTSARALSGQVESKVYDSGRLATWGAISWRAETPGGTAVAISTRSGNSSAPDDTWSAWSSPYAVADGTTVTSPPARYLQWRAAFTGTAAATPTLTSVTVASRGRNQRPRVDSITVHPPGVVFQKPYSTGETEIAGFPEEPHERRLAAAGSSSGGAPALGKRVLQPGLQTFQWKAEDPDGDVLHFDVWIRREGDTRWQPIGRELSEPLLVWDTTTVPGGRYVARVDARDTASQTVDAALTGTLESTPVPVDHAPPTVRVVSATRRGTGVVITLDVTDAESVVASVDVSIDGTRWRTVTAADMLFDTRTERVVIEVTEPGQATQAMVRATDQVGNSTAVAVPLPPAAPQR